MQVFFVLPLNTQRWLIIRQVSDFILHLHKRGWRQPGISAGPKSSFLSPFHGKAKYQLYRQAGRRKPREQRNMTIWILISCHFHNVLTLQKKKKPRRSVQSVFISSLFSILSNWKLCPVYAGVCLSCPVAIDSAPRSPLYVINGSL